MRVLKIAWPALLLWVALAPPAAAACVGLGCSCSVSASSLSFGTYNPLASGDVDAAGGVSVTCGAIVIGATISYTVTLGPGGGGNQLARRMSNGAQTLNYNLYTNAARNVIWGDGTGGTGTVSNSYLLSLIFSRTDNFTVYGRIPGGQNVGPGSYSDTIVATVSF